MRLLTISKISAWSAFGGSVAMFLSLQPQLRQLFTFLKDLPLEELAKTWHAFAALLVAGAAIGAQQAIAVDKRLNGKWFWVSQVKGGDGEMILRVGRGETTISRIDDPKARQSDPRSVLFGSTTAVNGKVAEDNGFYATGVFAARNHSLFYEWEYVDDKYANGWAHINWLNTSVKGWKSLFLNSELRLTGSFCMANDFGTGVMQFYKDKSDADKAYQDLISKKEDEAGQPSQNRSDT